MEKNFKKLNIANFAFLIIDIIGLISLIIFILSTRFKFLSLFADLQVELPFITRVALSHYYVFIIVILGLILIVKEWLIKKKLVTLIINVAAVFIILFLILIYHWAVYLPFFEMSQYL